MLIALDDSPVSVRAAREAVRLFGGTDFLVLRDYKAVAASGAWLATHGLATHDKSALRRLFDPSVADRVVHESSRPVLVVSGSVHEVS